MEHDGAATVAFRAGHGRSHARRGPRQCGGRRRGRLSRVVVRRTAGHAGRQLRLHRPADAARGAETLGRAAAPLGIRRDAGRSGHFPPVGLRRLHAHPRGRNREPDDDPPTAITRGAVQRDARPFHAEPLPRLPQPLFLSERRDDPLPGADPRTENLHEQRRPCGRLPALPDLLRPGRKGNDPLGQPRSGGNGRLLYRLSAAAGRSDRHARAARIAVTDALCLTGQKRIGARAARRRARAGGMRRADGGKPDGRRRFRFAGDPLAAGTDRTRTKLRVRNSAQTLPQRPLRRSDGLPSVVGHPDRPRPMETGADPAARIGTNGRRIGIGRPAYRPRLAVRGRRTGSARKSKRSILSRPPHGPKRTRSS